MVSELWRFFPSLVENNINGLLDRAQPNALRVLHIYRACRQNGLYDGSAHDFSRHLERYFDRPFADRSKSAFDSVLRRPLDFETYALFDLDFRSAAVDEEKILAIASWAHNFIRVSKKLAADFISLDVMNRTFRRLTNPRPGEKASGLEFKDFCLAWKSTVRKVLGSDENPEFHSLLQELATLDRELKTKKLQAVETSYVPGVFLTQTETDWTIAVRKAAEEDAPLPDFPLSRGPEKIVLQELVRAILLYTKSRHSSHPEILENKERIRATVIDRCDCLLGKDKRLGAA